MIHYFLPGMLVLSLALGVILLRKLRTALQLQDGLKAMLRIDGGFVDAEFDMEHLTLRLFHADEAALLGVDLRDGPLRLEECLQEKDCARLRRQPLPAGFGWRCEVVPVENLKFRTGPSIDMVLYAPAGGMRCKALCSLNKGARKSGATDKLLSFIMDSLPNPTYCKKVDEGFRYTACNQAWRDMFSIPSENLTDEDIFPPDLARRIRDNDLDLLQYPPGHKKEFLEAYIGKNGEKHHGLSIKKIIRLDNGTRLLLGITINQTEETRMRKQLKEQLRLLNIIFDNMVCGICIKNVTAGFAYTRWNKELEKQSGYLEQQVIGKTNREIHPWPGIEKYLQALDERTVVEKSVSVEFSVRTALGQDKIYNLEKRLLSSDSGEEYIIDMFFDISEQKKWAMESLKQREYQQKLLIQANVINDCLEIASRTSDYALGINDILRRIGELCKADRCYLYRYQAPGGTVADCTFEWRAPGIWPEIETQQDLDFALFPDLQQRMEAFQDMVVESISDLPPGGKAHLAAQGIQSLLLVPLRRGDGGLLGAIGIDFVLSPHQFQEDEFQVMHEAARVVELAWTRQTSLHRLQETAALQTQIFEKIEIPLMLFSPQGKIEKINSCAMRHLGKRQEELLGRPCNLICGSPRRPEWCPMAQSLASRAGTHAIFFGHGGHTYQVALQPIFADNGEIQSFLEYALDLTELNQGTQCSDFHFSRKDFIGLDAAANTRLNSLLEQIAGRLHGTHCGILFLEPQSHAFDRASTMVEYAAPGCPPLFAGLEGVPLEPDCVSRLKRHEILFLNDLSVPEQRSAVQSWSGLTGLRKLRGIFIAGLFLNDRLWGMASVAFSEREAAPPAPEDRDFFRNAAEEIDRLLVQKLQGLLQMEEKTR